MLMVDVEFYSPMVTFVTLLDKFSRLFWRPILLHIGFENRTFGWCDTSLLRDRTNNWFNRSDVSIHIRFVYSNIKNTCLLGI